MSENSDLGARLATVLSGLNRTVRRRVRARMPADESVRGSQAELLRLVNVEPGIGVSTAARTLHLADNSVSTLVNKLVAAGMLRRETDPLDRRAALLYTTPQAEQRLRDWETWRARLIGVELERLTEQQRSVLAESVPILNQLAELLGADETAEVVHD